MSDNTKIIPLRKEIPIKLVPAMKKISEDLVAFSSSNSSHTSMDIFKILNSGFSITGVTINDTWDYFLQVGKDNTISFINLLLEETSKDPTLIAVEVIDKRFSHALFWVGTAGFRTRKIDDFYSKCASKNINIPDNNVKSFDKVILTKDSRNSMVKFVNEVYKDFPNIFKDEQEEDIKRIGLSVDIPEESVDSLEQLNGFIFYVCPLNFPREFYTDVTPSDPTEKINPTQTQEEILDIQNEKENTDDNKMKEVVTESKKETTMVTSYLLELYETFGPEFFGDEVDLKKFKKCLGEYFESRQDYSYKEFLFENAIIRIPSAPEYSYFIKLWPMKSTKAKIKIFFDNKESFDEFLEEILPKKEK